MYIFNKPQPNAIIFAPTLMPYKKTKRFHAIKNMSNVIEQPEKTAGKWHTRFNNKHPIVLELACGKGEYTIEMAKRFPHKNFIGIDIKGNRLWAGAQKAQSMQLKNALFLRIMIEDLNNYFNEQEVDDIWIIYPDPQLKRRRHKKRLTHPRFLRLYQKIIAPKADIHLKTDSPSLFAYSREVLSLCNIEERETLEDAYHHIEDQHHLIRIPTHYEHLDIAQSGKVFYLRFQLHQHEIPLSVDQQINKLLGLAYQV